VGRFMAEHRLLELLPPKYYIGLIEVPRESSMASSFLIFMIGHYDWTRPTHGDQYLVQQCL
jgi:hypothetical protein